MKKAGQSEAVRLVVFYILVCITYIIWVRFFTIPVHLGVDEELYISMAKSFHYAGNFSENGQLLNYSCYFYSMLISLAYYFYSPENIVFLFRCIGIVCMISTLFPVYLLAKEIFGQSRKVWIITAISVIIPSMSDVAYCMQETLAYPLMLWIFYLVYRECRRSMVTHITRDSMLIAVLAALSYFVKTYLIIIPVAYCFFILIVEIRTKKKSGYKKMAFFSVIYFLIYTIGNCGLLYINNGMVGTNHYASQFRRLFPIDFRTILVILSCTFFYIAALFVYWGVLPCILTIVNRKKYSRQDAEYILFLELFMILMILEIVITIVVTAEGKAYIPHKFLYRYFQVFEIPFFCMFLKIRKDNISFKGAKIVVLGCFGYMILYYVFMAEKMRTAIIDAPLFLLLDNASRYIFPYLGSLILMIVLVSELIFIQKYTENKQKNGYLLNGMKKWFIFLINGMFVINLVQLPYYANVIAKGCQIQKEACVFAKYLNDNNISKIYYVEADTDRYEQAVYAYLKTDVIVVSEEGISKDNTNIGLKNEICIKAASNPKIKFNKVLENETEELQMGYISFANK